MGRTKKSKLQRDEERQILDEYHKMVTEEALEPLYKLFVKWKQGGLPYYELTEHIHQFHKKNQEIYKEFNYNKRDLLVHYAKLKLGRLNEDDVNEYGAILEQWGYGEDRNL